MGVAALLQRLTAYAVNEGDDDLTRLRKTIMMVLYIAAFLMDIAVFFVASNDIGKYTSVVMMVVAAVFFLHLVVTRHITPLIIVAYISICSLCITFFDLGTASESTDRAWPIQVVLIDILLVSRVGSRYSRYLVIYVMVCLAFFTSESMFRFGLYDIPGTNSQSTRRDFYTCSTLPCANITDSIQNYITGIAVFLLDFYFTRGFADSLVEEKAKVEASVDTAEKIARSLANFDLDSAEDDLTGCHDLPPKLHAAFDNILQNLKLYRPFLPDALFEGSSRGSDRGSILGSSVIPPGTGGEPDGSRIAVVFTDIQASTAIWEACPCGMKKALKLHNKTIRRQIDLHQGYEVKTIGDAFMVTFTSPTDAVDFGLAVQKALVACSWPNDLFDLPLCERDSEGLWGGLRVRVGVHYGEAEVELNAITGRFDYFGNTVNVAARVEAASVGGGVAVTPEVLAELTDRSSFIEIPVGSVSLKGVSNSKKLSIIIPEELRGRRSYVEGQLRTRGTTPKALSEGSHSTASRVNSTVPSTEQSSRLEHIANATVGCVEVRVGNSGGTADYTTVNEGVCRTLHSLDRCGGTVVAVVGSSITVGWNTAKKTSTHFESSLRFASFVLGRRCANSDVCLGLSSGPVVSATIGTHGQRFVTVMGDCVKLSCAMAAAAAEYRTCALFSSSSMTHFFTGLRSDLKNILRPLANWEVRAADKPQTLVVYEISIPRLYDTDLTSMVKQEGEAGVSPTGGEMSWCWSDAYWEAFTAGDQELIERHAPSDPVLSTVRGSAPKVVVLR